MHFTVFPSQVCFLQCLLISTVELCLGCKHESRECLSSVKQKAKLVLLSKEGTGQPYIHIFIAVAHKVTRCKPKNLALHA